MTHAVDTRTETRLSRVRASLSESGLDALLVSQPDNRRYLSGFTGSAGMLLISLDAALIATDFRYYEQAGLECGSFELVKYGRSFIEEALPVMLERAGGPRIGFEADHATYADVTAWTSALPGFEWTPVKGLVMSLRAVKDVEEVAALRAAIALADEAFVCAVEQLRAGMTERELAWIIESHMRTHGAQGVSFDIIVAAGPNGARPHARAGDAPLQPGQPIVIDMGARLNGYCSDLTRTICLGEPEDPEQFWKIYNTVLRAQMAAEASVRPGLTGREVDAVARELIAEAGYGEYFGHGLGHGVGLAIHEEPRFSFTNTLPITAGNVVTVEPGIYLPWWGGVRIEDIVLVTENGAEVLTMAPKEPIIAVP